MTVYVPGRYAALTRWSTSEVLDYNTSVELGVLPYEVVSAAITYTPTVLSPVRSLITGTAADTLYGGSSILMSADADLVSRTEHTVDLTASPATWTSAAAGTASAIAYSASGAQCTTDSAVTSSVRIGPLTTFLHGDIGVEFQPQTPVSATVATEVTLAAIELTVSSSVATLALIADTTSCFLRFTCTGYPERRIQTAISAASLRQTWSKLRVVRYGAYLLVYALNGTTPIHAGAFFVDGAMTLRLLTANQSSGSAQPVSTIYRNYNVTGGVWVDGALASDAVQASTRQIRARVPPARSDSRAGQRDISIFGPYGAGTITNGFEYIYPPRRTIIDGAATLFSTQDAAIRNSYFARWKPKDQ